MKGSKNLILFLCLTTFFITGCRKGQLKELMGKQNQFPITEINDDGEVIEEAIVECDSIVSNWKYNSIVAADTHHGEYSAGLYSNNTHIIDGVRTPLAIFLFYEDGDKATKVMLGLQHGVFRSTVPLVYYSIDGGPQESQSYFCTEPNILYLGGDDWVDKIKRSNKIDFTVELEDGTKRKFNLTTSGLDWNHSSKSTRSYNYGESEAIPAEIVPQDSL